jgi:hypothetical protein
MAYLWRRLRRLCSWASSRRDLSALGEKNPSLLEAMSFNLTQLQDCQALADELGMLQSRAFVSDKSNVAKQIRDRAFTYMRQLMSEVLDAAEYVFRNDRDRLEFYYSNYRSRMSRGTAAGEQAAQVEEPAATVE